MNEGSRLISALAAVRRKLQYERLLKGLVLLSTAFLVGSVLSSYLLAKQNFPEDALFWTRLIGGSALLFLAIRYVFYPLFRLPSRGQVARFLEERHAGLQDRLSTAVEVGSTSSRVHPGIRELIERDAWNEVKHLTPPRFYRPKASLFWMVVGLVSVLTFGYLFFVGPEAYPYSVDKIMWGWFDRDRPLLYSILLTPGNTAVGKRADVEIRAALQGFDSQRVRLFAKYENELSWERLDMQPDTEGNEFVFLFFDVRNRIDYYAQSEGIRSATYTIQVLERPRVERSKIVLDFPKYTGLKSRVMENGGDIRALVGTKAHFLIQTNQPVQGGKIQLENGQELPLGLTRPQELRGTLPIQKDDSYRIHLQDQEKFWNPGSDQYEIEALIDQPPTIFFTRPGRDRKVTNIEEVFTELRAEDDHGVTELTLRFAVNGGAEQRIEVDSPRRSRSFLSSHTFYLEEFNLQPGDFVSYYAEASDAVSIAATDIYFFEVEPYDREYYQAQQSGMPLGGGANMMLSKRQKEIIVATFNVGREKQDLSASEFKENTQTLALVQQRLQQEARTIVDRVKRRDAAGRNPLFRKMVEHLTQAILHMDPAHRYLSRLKPMEALPPERRSFQQLLRAEALFKKIQVSFAQNQAGGGDASAEELANLVDLELDKTKNQYETLHQSRNLRRERELDEALEKLKELAQRQQQLAERRRRQATGGSSGNASFAQEPLIKEAERLARQLERLSRLQRDRRLADVSRGLRRAMRDMRNLQSQGHDSGEAQMRAQRALQRLKQALTALNRQRQDQITKGLQQLNEDSARLTKQQEGVIEKIRRLQERQRSGEVNQNFLRDLRSLLREKSALQEDVHQLEGALHQSARQTASLQPKTSRKLKRAGLDIRDRHIPEKMQESSQLLSRGWTQPARQREEGVWQDLQEVGKKISEAQQLLGSGNSSSSQERLWNALNEIGKLVENLESLKDRAAERTEKLQPDQVSPSQQGKQARREGEQSGQPGMDQTSLREGFETGTSRGNIVNNPSGIHARHIRREWQERVREAEGIRQGLAGDEDWAQELDQLVRKMRRLDWQRLFSDGAEIARLKADIIDGFRQLELEINRAVEHEAGNRLRLVNEDGVPPEFRERVEEYYRALSEKTPQ